jgi:hypothetical protein
MMSACARFSVDHFPDGSVGYTTSCSGVTDSWATCQATANSLCGSRGYEILSTTGDHGLIAEAGAGNFFDDKTVARVMLIKCK